ncbi:hypothetical protein L1049_025079 [Liquidambar formosana]|uniref:C3H1-type domain-containing protein n=1 Tax=Liquidambar formosana TaxID=63359 RepID=A0AAP0X5A6_LIQFO
MKRSRKSNRVSWAPDVNLSQVRLFISEDCPSQVGLEAQDHLQAKASCILHSNGMDFNDFPPGFDGGHYVKQLKEEVFHIPQIKWKCPPKFVLSYNWHMVAGEESKEVEAQKLREMRVLEAVYPRPSAIPPSPSNSLDIEEYHHDDDRHTPIIPITPIEDEDATDLPSDLTAPINTPPLTLQPPPALPQGLVASGTPNTTQSNNPAPKPPASEKPVLGMLPGLEADVVAAASAALSAIVKSKEQGSMIDTDLLIKILSNPKMIEKLINDYGAPAETGSLPKSGSKPVTPLVPSSSPEPGMVLSSRPANRNLEPVPNGMRLTLKTIPPQLDAILVSGSKPITPAVPSCSPEPNMVFSARPGNGNLYPTPNTLNMMPPQSNHVPVSSVSAMKAPSPLAKDINYYKSLIKQHGGEGQETQDRIVSQYGNRHSYIQDTELIHHIKPKELKQKAQKPCIYFKSSKGCRNGSDCPYQHDMSYQLQTGSLPEAPSAKRIKLGREITGRT